MVKKSITKKVIDIEESDSSSDDNEVFEKPKKTKEMAKYIKQEKEIEKEEEDKTDNEEDEDNKKFIKPKRKNVNYVITEEEQTNKEERKGFRHHFKPLMNKLDEYIQNNTNENNKESKLTKKQLAELNDFIDDPTQKIKHSKKPSTIRDEYNEYLNQISPPQTARQQSTRVLRSQTYNKNDKRGFG